MKQTRVYLEYNRTGRIERVGFAYGATRNDIEVVADRGLTAVAVDAAKLDAELRKQLSRAKFASEIAPILKRDYRIGADGRLSRNATTKKPQSKPRSATGKARRLR